MASPRARQDLGNRLMSHLRQDNDLPAWLIPACLTGAAGIAALAWWLHGRRPAGERGTGFIRKLLDTVDLDTADHDVLAYIRDSLLGHRRRDIRHLLGDPQAAADGPATYTQPGSRRRDAARRWYYRLDRLESAPHRQGAALAIDFEESDRVRDARFLVPPEATV